MEYLYILGVAVILGILWLIFRKKINFFVVAITGKRRIQLKLYKECKVNDYLILNDVYFPIGNDHFRYIDTIIFGTKYVYIIKEIKQAGEIKIAINDEKWRVIYKGNLTHIDNPLLENRRRIKRVVNVVPGLEEKDIINMIVFTKTCTFAPLNHENKEFVVRENEVMDAISAIEKNSPIDVFDTEEVEKYANSFYLYGIESEKKIKAKRKQKEEKDEFDD